MPTTAKDASFARLSRLRGYLEGDPENPTLLADTIGAALDLADLETAAPLLEQYRRLEGASPAFQNLEALAALAGGRPADAVPVFERLLAEAPGDSSLRFNLAWCRAALGDHSGAAQVIDETVARAIPRAAAFHVQILHRLDRLDEALAYGLGYAEVYPDDSALMGALSVVALDAEDLALALNFAQRAGDDNDEGLATRGALALDLGRLDEALPLFDRAISINPDNARALLGAGLSRLGQGMPGDAAGPLRRSAELFVDYSSAWLATGWADLGREEIEGAREAFERALAGDGEKADAHGALAIVELCTGGGNAAEHAERALELDPGSAVGLLAVGLQKSAAGDPAGLERVREMVRKGALGDQGEALARVLAGLSARRPSSTSR